ncbi:MAG: hypothetical protein RLZZ562_1376 [Planctomycetota bacterium]
MKPKSLRIPAPVHHRPSGQDVIFLRDAEGRRRMVYLGEHGSSEAARRYREALSTYLAGKPLETTSKRRIEASEWPTASEHSRAAQKAGTCQGKQERPAKRMRHCNQRTHR